MQFTSLASVLAFASAVLAQTAGFDPIEKPGQGETIAAGSTYQIKWEPSAEYKGTVTINLLGGPSDKGLNPVGVVAKSIKNSVGTFDWAVGQHLGEEKVYGLRIDLDSDTTIFQYSFPFGIKGGSNGGDGNSTSTSSPTGSYSASGTATANATITTTSSHTHKTTGTSAPTTGYNVTGTSRPTQTDVTLTTTPTATTSSSPTTVPSNPAGTVAASSLALVGGLAMAIFAL